jgi:hypothetical protein
MSEDDGSASNNSGSTSNYRLTRVEREVAELRSKIESGQGAMLQAVAGVQTQLANFQITLGTDLANKFVSTREANDFIREMRERAETNARRLDGFDAIYIKTLDEARRTAETKRVEDNARSLRINLALLTSAGSLVASLILHFVKVSAAGSL